MCPTSEAATADTVETKCGSNSQADEDSDD